MRASVEDRLAANLERQLGVVVDDVTLTRGYWTHIKQDCYRWEAALRLPGESFRRGYGCYEKASVAARASTKLSFLDENEILAEPNRRKG
ncbi:MAG: hypothetical protein E6Q97_06990 [Desulfurellales bacterium]|nr:MAG: hypothetical protein E6Q97_06990 [Desulfurellales bacterium]